MYYFKTVDEMIEESGIDGRTKKFLLANNDWKKEIAERIRLMSNTELFDEYESQISNCNCIYNETDKERWERNRLMLEVRNRLLKIGFVKL